jgi:hypothetical protein
VSSTTAAGVDLQLRADSGNQLGVAYGQAGAAMLRDRTLDRRRVEFSGFVTVRSGCANEIQQAHRRLVADRAVRARLVEVAASVGARRLAGRCEAFRSGISFRSPDNAGPKIGSSTAPVYTT